MVRETKIKKNKVHLCEQCATIYKDKELAKKCEDWCKKHSSCNLEIIKKAIMVKKK